jgi:ArsR family transcriptional regulator
VTLDAHDHLEVAAAWNHVHPGFRPSALTGLLEAQGLVVKSCAVTSRERRAPHFSVVTALAERPVTRPVTRPTPLRRP